MMKQAITSMLSKAGNTLMKNRPASFEFSNRLTQCKVGDFDLWVDGRKGQPSSIPARTYYRKSVARLGEWVHKKYADMTLIDVGANVGDIIAMCRTLDYYPIVCIEGDDTYFKILKRNAAVFPDLRLIKAYVGDTCMVLNAQPSSRRPVADPLKDIGERAVFFDTLDNMLSNKTIPVAARMLRIHTGGDDLKVLKGASNYLSRVHPVLFFEYDRTQFEEKGDQGTDTLEWLQDLGYSDALFYDHQGRFMMSLPMGSQQVYQLHSYIFAGAFQYFDIALFHRDDLDIAYSFAKKETEYFN